MNKKLNSNTGSSGKVINKSFSELLDAFKKDGCPICNLNYSNIDSYFSSILYESVNDPGVRKKLRDSLGYCRDHSVQFIGFIESSCNRFGASIIIADVTAEIIKELDRFSKLSLKDLKKVAGSNYKCPACIYMHNHEHIYYSEILNNLENDDFFNKYLKNDGLCQAHLGELIKIIKDSRIRNKIIENQQLKFSILINNMNAFVKKHSGQSNQKISSDEGNAFKKAIRHMRE